MNSKYELIEPIGSGSFGLVYKNMNRSSIVI